ncbi:4-(cytidine 5'-diphospho)-2-C-methyl-D-erythritol kinase [Poseidonibacter ostreae]|uniref:4-diphosphocytidyl-2-C-methyl-D-erythritol kinase n=1 Tax=Poseidonibacter ostreae TaxID=2654171 RepID=A0A6L4WS55_9BACT|nr:4-(cytidine 5'-diphospho)-2-C-methyl-D-erythritol kinase [Poseidonibacter ostreae]KAB7886045.1 4-(cytidine 5'-diphospho)-2-C-methyl-D-erythritol kinase [Poseidonibacter ostreae]KAB7888687.1 4-(cytidine 5'-diphospho)-2-C-methyl-D-erythritol kinase [Poseidonibacter ostreae]KAB7892488.1 4-(cytidine 5'-diphospho)-2-C-methyl-D-erythritol kinase [Poseidonibacter ostreae]
MTNYKSYAKVNIFLKIANKRDTYHELVSRFVRVHNLYDNMSFVKTNKKAMDIIGDFGCKLESNTVYKAYILLKKYKGVEEFFNTYSVKIDKNIPEFAGLGGGSSNAATFLIMVNKYCELNLSKDELCKIAMKIGADVPFFVYEYDSANVRGIGEIVEKFDEEVLDIETITPKIECNTGEIFKVFREKFYKQISKEDAKRLLSMNSLDILKEFNIYEANDLYEPAITTKPELKEYAKKNWYFSGSGSSFFKVNNG